MTKQEVKKSPDHTLILELAMTYSTLLVNWNLGRGTKQAEKHLADVTEEMRKRGLLSIDDIKRLNS